jgi:tetratricopeptide (TPR) repeat protein
MHCNEIPNERGAAVLAADYETILEGSGEISFSQEQFEQLISYFENAGLLERALELAEIGIERFPGAQPLILHKIQLHLVQNDGTKALQAIDQALQFFPDMQETDLVLLRAEALSYVGAFPASLALLEKCSETASNLSVRANIHFVRSIILEQTGDFHGMFESIKLAIACDYRHEKAIRHLGVATSMTRRYPEALELCQALLDKDPYSCYAWYNLGQAFEYQGSYQEALQAFEYAFLANPAFEPAYREYIELCLEVQAYTKALGAIEDFLTYLEADPDIWLYQGKCYFHTDQFRLAIKSLMRTLELDSMCDEALFMIGKCYAREDAWSWAAYFFQKALELDGEMEEYLAAIGEAYFNMGMPEKGSEFWMKAIRTIPEEPTYWSRYATLLLNAGRPLDALDILREAVEYTVGSSLDLAWCACLYAIGRKQEAMEKLSHTLPELPDIHDALHGFLPEMESDPHIRALIAYYSPTQR